MFIYCLIWLVFFMFKRLGNKQDCEGALNESELRRKLELDKLTQKYKCPCQVVSELLLTQRNYTKRV